MQIYYTDCEHTIHTLNTVLNYDIYKAYLYIASSRQHKK